MIREVSGSVSNEKSESDEKIFAVSSVLASPPLRAITENTANVAMGAATGEIYARKTCD
jgi:hypothetical protein